MKKEGPLKLVLIMILGIILLFFIFDFGLKSYSSYILTKDAKESLREVLEDSDVGNLEQALTNKLLELKYSKDDFKVAYKDNKLYLVLHKKYYSIIKSLFSKNDTINTVRFKAYYNEYKEVIIEENNDEAID